MKWLTPLGVVAHPAPFGEQTIDAASHRQVNHRPYWHRRVQEGKPDLHAARQG